MYMDTFFAIDSFVVENIDIFVLKDGLQNTIGNISPDIFCQIYKLTGNDILFLFLKGYTSNTH